MEKDRKLIIAGNWKCNKTVAESLALVADLKRDLGSIKEVDVVVCPAFTALDAVSKALSDSVIRLGAQNMGDNGYGAFTGEICAGMLRDLTVRYVVLGHSERRQFQQESDALVARKALAAHVASLIPIVCVGETLAEREAGATLKVVQTQVERGLEGVSREQAASLVIAYEPVWAIGTGKVATTAQAQEVHAFIRGLLVKLFGDAVAQKVRILYGGSMKPANAPELLAQKDIDGGLIGGASLESRSFVELVTAALAAR